MPQFYDMLAYLRKRAGLSQQQLADALQLTRSAIGMYETGKREPDLETLELIADFFNVDMNTLTGSEQVLGSRSITDNDIMFAFWGGDSDMDVDDLADVRSYAEFVRQRKKKNSQFPK